MQGVPVIILSIDSDASTRQTLLLFLCLAMFKIGTSQELIPNGGFELYKDCPIKANSSMEDGVWPQAPTDWFSLTCGNSDYYNKCSVDSFIRSVNPRTGNGCVGIHTYFERITICREYVSTNLSQPLKAGELYCIRFYIKLSQGSQLVSSFIGAYLGPIAVSGNPAFSENAYYPQVVNSKPYLTDTTWTEISGIYRAKGGEKVLSIGNFSVNENSGKIHDFKKYKMTQQRGEDQFAYYWIDDVSVTEITNEFFCSPLTGLYF